MANLPSGWIDTGVTGSYTATGKMRVAIHNDTQSTGELNGWILHTYIEAHSSDPPYPNDEFGNPKDIDFYQFADLIDPLGNNLGAVYQQTHLHAYSSLGGPDYDYWVNLVAWTPDWELLEVSGPFRLGVQRVPIAGHEDDAPPFVQNYRLVYSWFGDRNTKLESRFGSSEPFEAPERWLSSSGGFYETQDGTDFEPVNVGPLVGAITFNCVCDNDLTGVEVEWRDLAINGHLLPTSGLNNGPLLGLGAGNVDAAGTGSASGGAPAAYVPYVYVYDVDILKSTNGETTSAHLTSSNAGAITCPYVNTITRWTTSWDNGSPGPTVETLAVDPAWAAAQPVPWDTADLKPRIWGVPPRFDPGTQTSWDAIMLNLAAAQPVADPIGFGVANPATDGVDITIGGGPGTDTPARRKWLGIGLSGKADPAFNPDLEDRTKRADGESFPWDWAGYAYLRIKLLSPASVTSPFTIEMTVRGVYVTVTDPHTTGSDRTDGFTATETAFEAVYQASHQPTEVGSYTTFDLHFPVSATVGGSPVTMPDSLPFYLGQVDSVELRGFRVGIGYTLSECELRSMQTKGADAPGAVHFKLDFGAPVQRGDYDAAHFSGNGGAGCGNLTDRTNCTEEFSVGGRGVRFCVILTGAGTGERLDTQHTLDEFAQKLNQVEGLTATYASSSASVVLSDGASTMATFAQDLEPQIPSKQFTAGAGAALQARVMCGELQPANGIPFVIYSRDVLGHGAGEALARVGAQRSPAGLTATLSTGQNATTDAHGYLEWGGVPANGTESVGVGASTVALRAHDKRRLLVLLVGSGAHCDLLQMHGTGWLFRSYARDGRVYVGRSLDAGATWTDTLVTADGATGEYAAAPTLAQSRWGAHLFLWYHTAANTAVGYRSDDAGGTWPNTPYAAFTDSGPTRYPRLVAQEHRQLLFYHAGGAIVRPSDDYGATLGAGLGPAPGDGPGPGEDPQPHFPVQLVAARVDRRNIVHVVAQTTAGGYLQHFYIRENAVVTAGILATSGSHPAYALGIGEGLLFYYEGGTLHARRLEADYSSVDAVLVAPGAYPPSYLGALISRHGLLYSLGDVGGSLQVYWSPNGEAWSTPA